MGDWLANVPAEVFTGGGLGGIVLLSVWLILTGRLVPRSTLDDARQDRDQWRDAYLKLQDSLNSQGDQLDQLLESARTTDAVLRALPGTGRYGGRERGRT